MKQLEFVNNGFSIEAADGSGAKTISGIAVPYGVEATVSDGRRVVINAGALPVDGKRPKLLVEHDPQKPIGTVTERVEAADGVVIVLATGGSRRPRPPPSGSRGA